MLPRTSSLPRSRSLAGRRVFAGRLAAAIAGLMISWAAGPAPGGELVDDFEGAAATWNITPRSGRVAVHERSRQLSHRGAGSERIVVESPGTTPLRFETPLGPAAVIDELRATLWVRASRTDVRLSVRVRFTNWISAKTRQPVEVLVPGTASRDIDRWEMLEVAAIPQGVARQLAALRLEHGPGSDDAATATHLVVEGPPTAGLIEVAIDDLHVMGLLAAHGHATATQAAIRDPAVQPAAAESVVDPPAGLARGVIEIDGLPFFPRSIDWNGEPLGALAALGFNCVRFLEPATGEQLADARRAGLWVVCPPPPIPDVDLREPESLPVLRNWDRVLMWDLGSGLSDTDVDELAERGRRVRACDPRAGRPLIASADSGLRSVSRHIDLLVARKTVLGTSLELVDYLKWLRERPRLARPGTPLLATISTEIDPRAARQAAALAGVGGRGLAVDGESLALAAFSAVAAGTRGILFTSTQRLDGDDREARARATAAREMNLRLQVLEPWGAAGRFAAQAQTSSGEVQAFVMEAARARMVVAWRCVQGSQIVARRYAGSDLPPNESPLTILVPGVPEAHQAWEVAPGGLKPLRQQRVTGGVSVTLDDFMTHAIILFSGDPAVTGHVQDRVRSMAAVELSSARAVASTALASAGDLLGRLPPQALNGPPPVSAVPMLSEAGRLAAEAEAVAASDPSTAVEHLRRAAAIAGQFERRVWENGVKAEGSMVASPLTASDTALAEEWQFVAARGTTVAGPELLQGGRMERIEDLAGGGWRHFARAQPDIRTAVEVSQSKPASGRGCLRLIAKPTSREETPVVVETPPLWITTPPIMAAPGKLLEITAQVLVPEPLAGSVDGLFVFDSLGGPALGERVGTGKAWRRLVLHRIVPPESVGEPVVVTFALTGMGEARIDDVSIRILERGGPTGLPATLVSAPAAPGDPSRGFPSPSDLLASPPLGPAPTVPLPAAATPPPAATAAPAWPGMNLEWPKLMPFGQSPDAPPPGPGGGTIDPFKRARTPPTPPTP
ncbi:MAG: hypothetical protein K8S94_08445 [Planctomycetia bacterium]|nr:hypothetical protein [Planctomycetia bacterium]